MVIRMFSWLLLLCLACPAMAQSQHLHGTVLDSRKESIPGATIRLKGTLEGTVTDLDGRFQITAPPGDSSVLLINALGFAPEQIWINARMDSVTIVLKEYTHSLEEVMIRANTVVRRSYTGSMSSISANTISKSSNQEKQAGTWQRSGLPGNAIRLEIGDNEYLPLKAASMAVQVDGFRVRVLMDCFFYNDRRSGLEGTFKLRLPPGASPYYFAFGETLYADNSKEIPYVDYLKQGFHLSPEEITAGKDRSWSRIKEARIVSKQKAARAYEETVSSRIDPALMEWAGADMFSCRVFPLTQGTLHRIVIGYDLNMTEALDFREYLMQLPDTRDLRIAVDMAAEEALQPEVVPAVTLQQKGKRLQFALQNPKEKTYTIKYHNVAPVQLYDSTAALFAGSYRIHLPEAAQADLPPRAVFLLDLSLSSDPDKFNVWLKLVEEVLTRNKEVIKQFAVLTFHVEQQWWQPYFVKNNNANVYSFLQYAQTLALEGATDLGAALDEASHPYWLKEDVPKHIFLMSDGDYNWGESNLNALQAVLNKGDRVHTYKTGLPGTNTAVLNTLSRVTGGFAFTVTGEEEAALAAKSLRYRPWTIEDMKVDGVTDVLVSGQPTQLYNGQKLLLAGRGRPAGRIYFRLNNGVETRELVLPAAQCLSSNLAPRIYGQLALAGLQPFNSDEDQEEATEEYAKHFRIPGETMSFLMLESEWDYSRYEINDKTSASYVQHNTVASLLQQWQQDGDGPALGNGKTAFMAWLHRLSQNKRLGFAPDSLFMAYVKQLPDAVFTPAMPLKRSALTLASQQTEEEMLLLGEEYLKYDQLLPLAEKRRLQFGDRAALKLMSSVIERNPADYIALRDLAMKATDWGQGIPAYYIIRRILSAREDEALSYLIAARALERSAQYDLAQIYYYICTHANWDSDYGSIEEISALYNYRMLDRLVLEPGKWALPGGGPYYSHFRQEQEIWLKDNDQFVPEADIVMILSWNRDNTDIDLHVEDPSKEECYFGHPATVSGGRLTIDVTSGFGPEMFVQKNAARGSYRSWLEYYSDDRTKTSSKAKAYVEFYKNWGRPNEKLVRKLIVLEKPEPSLAQQETEESVPSVYKEDQFEIQRFKVSKKMP